MSEFDFIESRKKSVSPQTKAYVKKCLDIIDRMHELMEDENILQKDLAGRLEKSESEISKWINGVQNFTLKSLVNLEIAFGKELIHVPCRKNKVKSLPVQNRNAYNQKINNQTFQRFEPSKRENFTEHLSAA